MPGAYCSNRGRGEGSSAESELVGEEKLEGGRYRRASQQQLSKHLQLVDCAWPNWSSEPRYCNVKTTPPLVSGYSTSRAEGVVIHRANWQASKLKPSPNIWPLTLLASVFTHSLARTLSYFYTGHCVVCVSFFGGLKGDTLKRD